MSAPERREQLLDATKSIALARGFHSVSIEAVAREAGITRPVVYGHFHDLPGLLEALVDREAARSLAQLEIVLDYDRAADDQASMLLASLRGYLEAVRSDPDTWRLVLMPQEGAPASLRQRIAQGRDAVVARLALAIGARVRLRAPVARPRADRAHAVRLRRRGRAAAAHRPRAVPGGAHRGPHAPGCSGSSTARTRVQIRRRGEGPGHAPPIGSG